MSDDYRRMRISESMRCQRMRVLSADPSHKPTEPDRVTLGRWERGNDIEAREIEKILRPFYADKGGELFEQKDLDSQWGPAHPDLVWVADDKQSATVREIKSRVGCGLESRDVWQTRAYVGLVAKELGLSLDSVAGIVRVVDPTTYESQDYPIQTTMQDLRAIATDMQAVDLAINVGVLPERECAYPQEGEFKMCGMREHCFKDWQPTDPGILGDKALAIVRAIQGLEEDQASISTRTKENAERITALKDSLKILLPDSELYLGSDEVGGVSVKVTRSVSQRVSYAAAVKAGALVEAADADLTMFTNESESSRVYIRETE